MKHILYPIPIAFMCTFYILTYSMAVHASGWNDDNPLVNNLYYTDFLGKINDILGLGVLHTTLESPRYDADESEEETLAYAAETSNGAHIIFYVKNGVTYELVAFFRQGNQMAQQGAAEVIMSACLAAGMTVDEFNSLYKLKPWKENTMVGEAFCKKSGKLIRIVTLRHKNGYIGVGIFASRS